ncbi:MAG: thermostable hemolysin [Oceanospirillaceae bacterium]
MSALLGSYLKEPVQSHVIIVEQQANREIIRGFTNSRFMSVYGADVKDFLPHSLALIDHNIHLKATMGYQSADQHCLYLEQYLSKPIEQCIAEHLDIVTPHRKEIVEVGNLASISYGGTLRLIINLANYFKNIGFKWMVMTAIPQVISVFQKLGIETELKTLTKAKAEAVRHSESDWGSYYEKQPFVVCANILSSIKSLENNELMKKIMQHVQPPAKDANYQLSVGGA